jgi:transcriptional regulator with XRE-family HTH domain
MLRVRFERLRRGWNQTALAFHAGMSVTDVSRVETGRLRPYPKQLQRLATALEIEASKLLEQVDERDAR